MVGKRQAAGRSVMPFSTHFIIASHRLVSGASVT
jgi:hypothetical protein